MIVLLKSGKGVLPGKGAGDSTEKRVEREAISRLVAEARREILQERAKTGRGAFDRLFEGAGNGDVEAMRRLDARGEEARR